MLVWALVLFLAHNHAEKHIQAFQSRRHYPQEALVRTPTQPTVLPAAAQPQAAPPEPQPPAPVPVQRTWCVLSPAQLLRLFNEGATQLQSQSLVETYITQWRLVAGTVTGVEKLNVAVSNVDCKDSDQTTVSLFFDPDRWDAMLRSLVSGDPIKAYGQILAVHKTMVVFHNCEIVD